MKADWLCKMGGQPCGPFSFDQLQQLARAGTITATTEVRRTTDERWFTARRVPGLISAAEAGETPPAPPKQPSKPLQRATPLPPPPPPVAAPSVAASPAGAVPVGVPVTPPPAPVSPSQAPVSPSQAPVSPVAVVAVASASAPVLPDFTLAPPPVGARQPAGGSRPAKGGRMVVYGLAALVGVVAAVGGAVLFIQWGGASSTETIAAAADNPTSEDEAAVDETAADGEANPVEANPVEGNPTAAPQSAANSSEGEGESSPSAAAKAGATIPLPPALRKFNAWKDPRTIQGFRSGGRVSLKGVWLAADGQGERIGLKSSAASASSPATASTEPPSSAQGSDAAPLAGATAPTASPVSSLEPAVPPRYIVCQVEISNTGTTPLKYDGWNEAASSAALLDESLAPLALAPASETPGVERLAAVFIPPGGSAIDTLVFRAPAKSVQTFHLALPQGAISTRADGYFGLLIPPEKLFEAPAAPSAAPAGGEVAGKPAGRKGSSAPPDFETLQRQINGGVEKAMDAAKGD